MLPRILTGLLVGGIVGCIISPAFACSDDRVTIHDLKTSVDDVDPGDELVYMTGTVESLCPATVTVHVTIAAEKADGTIIASHVFVLDNVPAGGQSFDLTGDIPYDRGVEAYEVTSVAVKDAPLMPTRRRNSAQRQMPATAYLAPGAGQAN